jgi:broad specificity phosphatase PhoE
MKTVVHLLRHGEVLNPDGILYGRRPGYVLTERGQRMAERVSETLADRDVTVIRSSPLERTRLTAEPTAKAHGLEIEDDERVIESSNVFEGHAFGQGKRMFRQPSNWKYFWNPFRPSWGEPYRDVVDRMMAAIHDVRRAAEGHEALVVSHQLPIWITRLHVENRSFLHDPRRRQCTLCSLTSLEFEGEDIVRLTYSEPAGDLIPLKDRSSPFSSGGASEEDKPASAG